MKKEESNKLENTMDKRRLFKNYCLEWSFKKLWNLCLKIFEH